MASWVPGLPWESGRAPPGPATLAGSSLGWAAPAPDAPVAARIVSVNIGPPWHFLNFLPLPHGQGWLRPIFGPRSIG